MFGSDGGGRAGSCGAVFGRSGESTGGFKSLGGELERSFDGLLFSAGLGDSGSLGDFGFPDSGFSRGFASSGIGSTGFLGAKLSLLGLGEGSFGDGFLGDESIGSFSGVALSTASGGLGESLGGLG